MYIILYIYKEYNKSMGKGGKSGKSCGKVFPISIYRVYNKRVYKEYVERVRKVRERVFLFSVYRYSIIEGKKGAGQR